MRKIKHIIDVVEWGLCIGCGACYSVCEKDAVTLQDMPDKGIRPRFDQEKCGKCTDCLDCCPGYRVDARRADGLGAEDKSSLLVGPTLEVWEGYAFDQKIRHRASSGGLLSALALYCLQEEKMSFVMHTGMHDDIPWKNQTVQSRTREDLFRHAGSRYCTSSPCDSLRLIEKSDRPCVFIGKPCDAAAVSVLRKQRPQLDEKLGLVLTFCCAGTPSSGASADLLREQQVDLQRIHSLHYRGFGWPGGFASADETGNLTQHLGYIDSWHILQKQRPFRCKLCPDGLGELADITCGDAWHRYDNEKENPGLSIAMVRTSRGRELLKKALDAGYVTLEQSSAENAVKAQGLTERRKEIFGRQAAMYLLGVPATQFKGFNLFRAWLGAPAMLKIKSVAGTARRLIQRDMLKKIK